MFRRFFQIPLWLAPLAIASASAFAADDDGPAAAATTAIDEKPAEAELTVEELTDFAKDSIVMIYQEGRTAGDGATGTGFIIEEDGLIATSWHVINDGRRITVELHDGTKLPATEVYAWDRRLDLALIRIKPDKPLKALKLGDSEKVIQGQRIVALGNPRGLKYSVVEGVISAIRDDVREGPLPMLQIAIPVEAGNSGGPIVDLQGNVLGIITLKSMVTENLGFATPVNGLHILLDKPNPMPIERWATIGALDSRQWTPKLGAIWTQRAGRIQVKGTGDGFGGRSLCFSEREVPKGSYELQVEVKLDDESGAAGLLFEGDGADIHYGLYPSGGRVRLTRFQGPDVYSWEILEQLESASYKPGDWNQVKVRVEPDKLTCWVNGEELVVSTDAELRGGKVGLCKFRTTEAEFRGFRIGERLDAETIDPGVRDDLNAQIEAFLETNAPETREQLLGSLGDDPAAARASLQATADALDLKIAELTRLRRDAGAQIIADQLAGSLEGEEAEIDLFHAGLLIAKLANPELDVDAYREVLDQMAAEIRETLADDASEAKIVDAVRKFMFEDNGFHGSRLDYYHESNSFLNEVIDDREGIPISLSVVFIELARRAGSKTVHGVGLPSHFVAGYKPAEGEQQLLDVFESGALLSNEEATEIVASAGQKLSPEHLEPVPKRAIIERMLRNLIGLKKGPPRPTEGINPVDAIPYLHLMLAISPGDAPARLDRALLRYQDGDIPGAKVDLRWLLQNEPPGVNLPGLRAFYEQL